MALIKCKECGTEISKKAKECPKCGAPAKKKTSLFTWIVTIFIGLWFIGYLANPDSSTSSLTSNAPSPKEIARKNIKLDFSWTTEGFGNIMEANFTVHNNSKYDIKDIEISCTHFAKSGTKIDSNDRTIYEIVKKKSTKKFPKFNMGFIHSQANSSSCQIKDFVVINP